MFLLLYHFFNFFHYSHGMKHTKEIKANFYIDKKTVLLVDTVIGCEPTIQVIYE